VTGSDVEHGHRRGYRFLDGISNSLYLWHFPVFCVVSDNTGSWPALRLKRRLGQRRPAKRVEPEPASVRV
jgi:peptidoglycan/LPS O-acetylase OafA/YrhL